MTTTQSAPAIHGIDITAYVVRDGERAKRFYRDRLGLALTTDYGPQGGEFELADGATFGVWQVAESDWKPCSGVMFAVADISAAVEGYRERGVAFTPMEGGEIIGEFPSCRMAMANDSEGNSFMLHERKA